MRAGDWIRKLTILAKRLHYLYLALTLKFSIIYYTHTPYHMFPSSELSFMSNNYTSDKPLIGYDAANVQSSSELLIEKQIQPRYRTAVLRTP